MLNVPNVPPFSIAARPVHREQPHPRDSWALALLGFEQALQSRDREEALLTFWLRQAIRVICKLYVQGDALLGSDGARDVTLPGGAFREDNASRFQGNLAASRSAADVCGRCGPLGFR